MELSVELQLPKTPLFTGTAGKVVDDEIRAAMHFGVLAMQQAILPLVPVDRGFLRGGVQVSVTGQAVDLVGRVFNPLGHAMPVEAGARPHFPPLAPLEGWVHRKLGMSGREARSVAFLVARAIARRGLKPREFFKRGFNIARPRVEARFRLALERIKQRLEAA